VPGRCAHPCGSSARLTSGYPGGLRDSATIRASPAPCLLLGSFPEIDSRRIVSRNPPRPGAPARSATPIGYRENESTTARGTGGGGTFLFIAPDRPRSGADRSPAPRAQRFLPPMSQLAQRDQDEPVPVPTRGARGSPRVLGRSRDDLSTDRAS